MTVPMPPAPRAEVPALSIRGLAKRFGAKMALDGISLDVPAGSFFGIVGPNGAGKTTMLSLATGLLRPDYGTALVHGVDVWAQPLQAKRLLGTLPDGVRLFDRLSGEQLLTYAGPGLGQPRCWAWRFWPGESGSAEDGWTNAAPNCWPRLRWTGESAPAV